MITAATQCVRRHVRALDASHYFADAAFAMLMMLILMPFRFFMPFLFADADADAFMCHADAMPCHYYYFSLMIAAFLLRRHFHDYFRLFADIAATRVREKEMMRARKARCLRWSTSVNILYAYVYAECRHVARYAYG